MIPTSIDGTDITGATIDGQDVQEITVDGQTVFTSGPQININNFPVAYSNLVAWYPFDSATYGGSNENDVTAFGGSGDDTAYDGTPDSNISFNSNGVTDINAGASSGGLKHNTDDAEMTVNSNFNIGTGDLTFMFWVKDTNWSNVGANNDDGITVGAGAKSRNKGFSVQILNQLIDWKFADGDDFVSLEPTHNQPNALHIAGTRDGGTAEVYINGSFQQSGTGESPTGSLNGNDFTTNQSAISQDASSIGTIDDIRVYNKKLSSSEISQIYNNTKP